MSFLSILKENSCNRCLNARYFHKWLKRTNLHSSKRQTKFGEITWQNYQGTALAIWITKESTIHTKYKTHLATFTSKAKWSAISSFGFLKNCVYNVYLFLPVCNAMLNTFVILKREVKFDSDIFIFMV